ncbi:MAG: ATP-binding protein [Desulfuromonadales bacterium]
MKQDMFPDKATVDFAVREQIMHAVSLVDAALTNENIAIHLDTPYELILNGLPNEFSQVLLNLLTNAQDAIKESGAASGNITIRIFERNGLGCISIRDDGGGIPADIIDRIFEPYFSTKSLGTGIGLYMSKMIVERSMGGAIEARNVEGGAEFVIVTRVEGTPS